MPVKDMPTVVMFELVGMGRQGGQSHHGSQGQNHRNRQAPKTGYDGRSPQGE